MNYKIAFILMCCATIFFLVKWLQMRKRLINFLKEDTKSKEEDTEKLEKIKVAIKSLKDEYREHLKERGLPYDHI